MQSFRQNFYDRYTL